MFHGLWGLSWGDLPSGEWNHLEVSLFTYRVLGLGWLGQPPDLYEASGLSMWSFYVSPVTWHLRIVSAAQ